jgi:VanZ family protein
MKQYLKYNWPSILWAAFIFVICMMPHRHIPHIVFPYLDKIVHTGVYFVLACLFYFGWLWQSSFQSLRIGTFIKVLIVCAVYGLLIEIMQGLLTTDRSFEMLDELADIVGALLGLYGARWLFPKIKTA